MRLKNEIIERIIGYNNKRGNKLSEDLMNGLNISKATAWRYVNENRDNGPLTSMCALRIIADHLNLPIEYLIQE